MPPLAFSGALAPPAAAAPAQSATGGASVAETAEKSEGLSFEDVKKYGVAGTVAYVLTELAFWAVAAPVASYSLYTTSGHWPDLLTSNEDRAAVAAFIFAGANIARAFVPIRLGAALALAPWVDENLISKFGGAEQDANANASQRRS